jgi:flagellar hook-length control protein FliK
VQQQPAAISVALPVPAALPQHGQGSQAAKEIGPAATQPQATNPVDTKGVATAPPPHPVTDAPPTVPSAPVAVPAADMSTSPPPPAPEATLQAAAPVSGHSALTTTAPQVAAPQAGAPQGASPAAQLAPALVQMAHTADGTQRLTVRLTPPDLGQVQIRIDRPTDAAAHVDITVEKPETLTLLLRDQPQLQRALDQAGVPAEGRSVSFHVASPEQSSRSEPATAPTPGVAAGGLSGDGSHGAARQGGQPTQQQHSDGQDDSNDSDFLPMTPDRWVRAGLDITA